MITPSPNKTKKQKVEKTLEIMRKVKKEFEKTEGETEGIKRILKEAIKGVLEIYEVIGENKINLDEMNEKELIEVLKDGKEQLEIDTKEEKKVMIRWKLRQMMSIIEKSIRKAEELIEKGEKEREELKERLVKALMEMKMLEITTKEGKVETKETLQKKTNDELIKYLEGAVEELENIVGKRPEETEQQ